VSRRGLAWTLMKEPKEGQQVSIRTPHPHDCPACLGDGLDGDGWVSLADRVVARVFLAGLALQSVRAGGPEAAGGVDRALGQLDQAVREIRDVAFRLESGRGTRVRPLGRGEW